MSRTTSPRGLRPHELRTTLQQQVPGPLYLCLGDEPYLIDQSIEIFHTAVIGPETDVFNESRFVAGETPAHEIVGAAGTFPAFAERRLVIVTRGEAFNAADQEALSAYIDAPSPSTCFVLVMAKGDQRRRFFSSMMQRAVLINCQPLFERELPAWLQNHAASMGLRLTAEALHALVERTGSALHALSNELQKLRDYVGRPHTLPSGSSPSRTAEAVTVEQLLAVSAGGRERSLFELTDAVGNRRTAQALGVTRALIDQGDYPPVLIVALTRHFRRLWMTKGHLDAGGPATALPQLLGVAPRYAETVRQQASRFSLGELEAAMARCLVADAQIKGGRIGNGQVVEFLVLELCQGVPGPVMVTPA